VRAALDLWAERGFEGGVEQTTVEEIVQAAGVTKGTFYFHFARKEEILLEMGWDTADVVNEEVRRCLTWDRSLEDSVRRTLTALSHHVRAASPAAVGRAAAEFRSNRAAPPAAIGRRGMSEGFSALFARAQERGEVSRDEDPDELGLVLQAIVMSTLLDWGAGEVDLGIALRRRVGMLVAGLRARLDASSSAPAAGRRSERQAPSPGDAGAPAPRARGSR
jgi:AcrR family transcriptional regulator